ncbi:hypothetical protein KFE98_01145 [bacterium SCSIO 12741]|nr:hypothetical protein KFE98_01145 [bacterium SCSIO 12741]
MLHRIPIQLAVQIILGLSGLILIFHGLILSGVIPFQYVWGGRLENQEQMIAFESISVIINLLMAGVAAIKGGYINPSLPQLGVRILLWLFTGLFFLNTLGNLIAVQSLETWIATPITFLLFVLYLRLALHRD